eukprot:CAMPEP_0172530706 /NCGR_PEP_ID=MMETSP1067-20121228/4351_1 /TAXON_ID=265564 ORGANISM="Thalassiosira punctigera, Strain Tpunct2005C2" /NCGR_SAMPLE_ID=MMETSP1067 /ASSEMBLY_ACC=CAM_ASM_000444 /LENGTH=285 /DNA_ID=CAMNT_0013314951 /DNA_START=65 /DNA_END=919 /DNA_ORIENTATION=+
MNKLKTAKAPPPRWQSILLPLIAGFLHLRVFYYAAFHCILRAFHSTRASESTSEEFMRECFLIDRAVFVAYMFDLACCYLRVIPFSRCRCSRDIIGHHMPTLLLALPLAVPLWGNLRQFESTSFSILDFKVGNEQRNRFIDAYTLASGFAYASSLNEVFMCFQRVEMSLQGVNSFNDISSMKNHFFTSRFVVYSELCYKLSFFWGMSIIACKACCDFDKSLYDFITAPLSYDNSIWSTMLTIYTSPAVLRGALFRAFSVVMYPSMGMRCLKKIQQLHREGKGKKI